MKIGLQLPQNASPADIAHLARRAEESGYASLWVSDHLLLPASGSPLPPLEIMEPVVMLAYAAAITRTIKLGTSVLVLPYRNPVHLAKELATLSILCGGRLVAGVGSGWLEAEFRALRVPYRRRGPLTDESIRLMRTLWASDEVRFEGRFFSFSHMRFGPRPPAGKIPIWVGGLSRRAVARALELGDGYHGSRMTPEQFGLRLRWLREIASAAGRDLQGFAITHRVYLGFANRWTETGGYFEGLMAPCGQLADYLNRFAQLGIEEIVAVPLENSSRLDAFLDRFDREVRPNLS
jgi:probable F420-dependent oxidoreductase